MCSFALLGGLVLPVLAQAPTNLLANPTFADADGDKQPDKWRCNGAADGTTIKVSVTADPGVVQLLDADKAVGAGLAQYVAVQAGHKYQLSAQVKNTGSLGIYLEYLDKIPSKEAMVRQHLLGEDTKVSATESADFKTFTVSALAPPGATQARVWFYVPKIGVTDALIKDPVLQDLGAVAGAPTEAPAVAPAAPEAPKAPKTPRAAAAVTTAPADAAAGGPTVLANPEMKDADGDGLPDGWRVFPDASGEVTKVSMDAAGGVHLVDIDKTKGIGLLQQLPAQAGVPYTLSATLKGTGSLSLNLLFLSGKPARDSDLKAMLLDTKRTFGKGTPEGQEVSFTATAPAGTAYLRAWLYSPNIGVTDVTVTKASLTAGTLTAATLVAPKTNDKLLFVGDFESGDYTGWQTQFPKSSKGTIVTTPVRAGKYASRSELTYEDFKNYGKTDSMQRRCEIYKEDVGKPGEERWYGFSVYLTKGFDDDTFDIVMQIHNHPDPGEPGKSPILTLETHGKEWWINDRWDKNKISQPGEHGSGGTITSNNIYKAPYETEKWTDWAYHVKWALDDSGLIEIYKDGVKVAEYKGPNCYNDEQPFYMKIGVYKPAYRATSLPQRVIYHDEVRIGNEKATLADVSPPKA